MTTDTQTEPCLLLFNYVLNYSRYTITQVIEKNLHDNP